jgi:hypothetical protein
MRGPTAGVTAKITVWARRSLSDRAKPSVSEEMAAPCLARRMLRGALLAAAAPLGGLVANHIRREESKP